MNQPLDLGITLTPPPDGASSDILASVALHCEQLGLSHAGGLLADPLTPREREDLRWYLEEYWKWPFEGFLERGKRVEQLLPAIGKRLYHSIFGNSEARQMLQTWGQYSAKERQISIISNVPKVLSLPWELLHTRKGFLALRTLQPISIVRRLPKYTSTDSLAFTPPLRILLVTARPKNEGFVDPRGIARELVDELEGQVKIGAITVEFLRPPTFAKLRERLRNKRHPIHVLHFDGHGTLNTKPKPQGVLAFENEAGWSDPVEAEKLAILLQESGVRLVVLTACQSAMGASDDGLSSAAAQLIHQGVGAVVAMSTSVLAASAARYTEAFYRALTHGISIPVAHERARQRLQRDPRRHLLQHSYAEEGNPVELIDWWLPHLYQQHPVTFLLANSKEKSQKASVPAEPFPRLSAGMPAKPRYGFTGRMRELLEIERQLLRGKLVLIHGFGGVGKTALAREVADWLTRTSLYSQACFVSFEHGGDEMTLLSALGHFLGIYTGSYHPEDRVTALEQIAPVLKKQPTLIVADNLESILPSGEAPLELAERTALWETLLELTHLKAAVILTSRGAELDGGSLKADSRIAQIQLSGLDADDAYLLASNLLNKQKIDRSKVPYVELRDLLSKLAYLPLAIQLVLPALKMMPVEKIRGDFEIFLDRFVGNKEMGHNQSLLASLEYSLSRLSPEHQAFLPYLAFFESGALENMIPLITEISEDDWANLRMELEKIALLMVEQVHEDISAPFVRFHPVLVPYLRSQPRPEMATLRTRYVSKYLQLAKDLSREHSYAPQATRAIIQYELPNMQHALEILLQEGKHQESLRLAQGMNQFFMTLGRRRELAVIQRRLESIAHSASVVSSEQELMYQMGLGEDELRSGDIKTAQARFEKLLSTIEALPLDTPWGLRSPHHAQILGELARCLRMHGRLSEASVKLREALVINDELLAQQPENQMRYKRKTSLLTELGNLFRDQGRYDQAEKAYKAALSRDQHSKDIHSMAITLLQLGILAAIQIKAEEAKDYLNKALILFKDMNEPEMQAVALLRLGEVARIQEDWSEAEASLRSSLMIYEQHHQFEQVSDLYYQLGVVAELAKRPLEAESWYQRVLELETRRNTWSRTHLYALSQLAHLLVNEVQAKQVPRTRLLEAREYAEKALELSKSATKEDWLIWGTLAEIEEIEGRTEQALIYRKRDFESYASFQGNRQDADRLLGGKLAYLAAAAQGNRHAQAMLKCINSDLQQVEITADLIEGVKHILAGEREWNKLIEHVSSRLSALMLLRILETRAEPQDINNREDNSVGQLIAAAVAAGMGHAEAKASVEEALPHFEAYGYHITESIHQIWSGQRDFELLSVGLDETDAFIVNEIVKKLKHTAAEVSKVTIDGRYIFIFITAVILATEGNFRAREIAGESLTVLAAAGLNLINPIRRILVGERDKDSLTRGVDKKSKPPLEMLLAILGQIEAADDPDSKGLVNFFIGAVAYAAGGDHASHNIAESLMPGLEEFGYHISAPIQRLWAGERNIFSLVKGLKRRDLVIILDILERLDQIEYAKGKRPQMFSGLTICLIKALDGNQEAREKAEMLLPLLESAGLPVVGPLRHMLAGERNFQTLVMGLNEGDQSFIQGLFEILHEITRTA